MAGRGRNIEFDESRNQGANQFSFRSLMDGNVLTQRWVIKQTPYVILWALISLLVIANRNHAEKMVIRSNELQKEVKELRSQAITTSSELIMMSRQSRVELLVQERGLDLVENKEPLIKLKEKE